jgi:DNA-directed RNA polymerase subunit beta
LSLSGEIIEVPVEKVDLIDISPRQVVGASAALIPFLQMMMLLGH